MASRNIEKVKFPVVDMLRNEQEEKKNTSVEKDDFSEVVKEYFQKIIENAIYKQFFERNPELWKEPRAVHA